MKKRRKRAMSIDAQIRAQAKQIYATGMAEAYKGAALALVGQKLDEIKMLLQAAGFTASPQVGMGQGQRAISGVVSSVVEHPCSYCGKAGVYRTKPDPTFNPKGTWLCRSHLGMRTQHERVGLTNPVTIAEAPPPVAVTESKPDTGADVKMEDVMAQLGVQGAEQVQ